MRKSTHSLSLALALVALVTFTIAPMSAEAGARGGDSQGIFIKFGNGGFRWHDGDIKYVENRRHGARRHHGARSHYDEYTRHERKLINKRDKLQYKTEKALRKGNFEKAQRRLTRLIEVDYHLQEHYSAHASCNH